jgi:phosphoglycolate phosphatase
MLAVATLKREDYAIDILKHFGLAGFYNIICGSDHESKMSKADVLLKCIGLLKAERSDCVLIGDTVHDAIGAQQAEIDFLAVTFGFGFKDPSDVAAYPTVGVCDSAAALQKFLDME